MYGKESPSWRREYERHRINSTSTAKIKIHSVSDQSKCHALHRQMVSKIGVLCNQQDQSKCFAELVKHCANKRQKDRTPEICNGETASGFALLACQFTIRGMGMDSP